MKKVPKRTKFSLYYVLMALALFYLLNATLLAPTIKRVSYSEFTQLLEQKRFSEVVVDSNFIRGVVKDGESSNDSPGLLGLGRQTYVAVRLDPKLAQDLAKYDVPFRAEYESAFLNNLLGWIFPLLLLFGIWYYIFKRMGPGAGVMTFGKSKAKLVAESDTKTTFKDVAGVDEAQEELQEIVQFLKSPQQYQQLGGKIPKGVLLVGPPGTGKTLLAKTVAGEASVNFFSMSGSDFVEMFVGVGAARVRDLFEQAKKSAPCMIFIDELDALGKARGVGVMGGHDEREQTLNQLLVEMDGFEDNNGVIIMAATNRPEILDPALLRAGRFDRHVLVDRPDLNGREAILKIHARRVKLAEEVDLRVVAQRTPGFVGSDLANVMNEAALLASRDSKKSVGMEDIERAIDRIIAGLEKKNRLINEKERKIVAIHESGHAIVARYRDTADKVHKITIVPRGIGALGLTLQLPTEDRYLMSKTELIEKIDVLLGGRAAEKIACDDISTGAQNDLVRATDIANKMITEYGMNDRIGTLAYTQEPTSPLGVAYPQDRQSYSEATAQNIDEEVRKMMRERFEIAETLLKDKRGLLDKLTDILLDKETIEADEFEQIVDAYEKEESPTA